MAGKSIVCRGQHPEEKNREESAREGARSRIGGFSVSIDRVPSVNRYIERQEEHHRRRSFHEELDELLRELGLSIGEAGLL